LQEYFDRFVDYGDLRGILENNSRDLSFTDEMDKFIVGLQYSDQYVRYTFEERRSLLPELQAKYLPGQIVSTLEQPSVLIIASPTPSRVGTTLTSGAKRNLLGSPY
jgi:hypothetical protein